MLSVVNNSYIFSKNVRMLLAISFCAILLPLVIINLILSHQIMLLMISLQQNCTAMIY